MPADGGIRFGQYVLLRRIARGGMAEVFLAQQRGLEGFDRRVAIKRILPHLADATNFVQMFLSEAKLAAQLAHPNVVHIYEFGKVEGDYFIAMEYIDGVHAGSLFKHGEREKLPVTFVARIGADAASALHYAHDLRGASGKPIGLVHRDVSPANIMISFDGVVKLCDFGIAKAAALSDELTNPGQVKGKYAYMSPEQTIAAPLDGRSDVFSLAIVLWELLTGKFIVPRGDAIDAMRAIRDGKLEPIERAAPDTPKDLAAAITWALQPRREQRATAAELAQALEAFIKSSPEIATAMQVSAWIRERFVRESTGQHFAIAAPNASTQIAGGGTAAAPGTQVASGTVGASSGTLAPVTPPSQTAGSRVVSQLAQAGRATFGNDFDEDAAKTIKRHPFGAPTVVDDEATKRALEEATLRDRPADATLRDAAAHVGSDETAIVPTIDRRSARVEPPIPTGFATARDSKPRAVPGSGPRASIAPGLVAQGSVPLAAGAAALIETDRRPPPLARGREAARNRTLRIAAMIAGLIGLALVSFAIALAASESSRSHAMRGSDARASDATAAVAVAAPGDAVEMVVVPATANDAAPLLDGSLAPPASDAGTELGYLELSTKPDGGNIRVGEQSRTSPADFVLPAGDVYVTAELDGYAPEHRVIHLLAYDHEKVEIAMTHKLSPHERPPAPTTGRLSVRTSPYSEVFEGNHKLGETPFAELELPPGPHVLTFKNPKHPTTQKTIQIVAGKSSKLQFDLP